MGDELVQYIYENVKYMSKFVKERISQRHDGKPEGTYLYGLIFPDMDLAMKSWST